MITNDYNHLMGDITHIFNIITLSGDKYSLIK